MASRPKHIRGGWGLRWSWSKPESAPDLEMQANSGRAAQLGAEDKLLHTLFGTSCSSSLDFRRIWGSVYFGRLRRLTQDAREDLKCFFTLSNQDWPPDDDSIYLFMDQIALIFHEDEEGAISVDEILVKLCGKYDLLFDELDAVALDHSRRAIFVVISWLTMLFEIHTETRPDQLQLSIPFTVDGLRTRHNIDDARLPLHRVIRSFGPMLPNTADVVSLVGQAESRPIHASCLNVESLSRIDRIRIVWTDSLGCHLLFDPLGRMLSLYRYPSVCALNSLCDIGGSTFEVIYRDCYPHEDHGESILTRLNQEVLLSYRLLFGQTKSSRQHFQKVEKKNVAQSKAALDPLLNTLCEQAMGSSIKALPPSLWPNSCRDHNGHLLELNTYSTSLDFPVLGTRLLKIQEFDQRQQPHKLVDLWRDRRNPLQWYAFWAVLYIGGITIIAAILQVTISIIQLVVTWPHGKD